MAKTKRKWKLTALSNIRDDRTLTKYAKLITFMLVAHANEEGKCFPGIGTLAEECDISPNSVSVALNEIIALGEQAPVVIRRLHTKRKDGGRGRASNWYFLTLPLIPPKRIKSRGGAPAELNPQAGINSTPSTTIPIDSPNDPDLIPVGGMEARQGSPTVPDANLEPGPKGTAHRPVHSPEATHIAAGYALAAANANGKH